MKQENSNRADELIKEARSAVIPLHTAVDLTPLIDYLGDTQVVMLGEASHGTADFYAWRSELSMRLITEKGFNFIAVEGDWPECQAINRYIHGEGYRLLSVFEQFKRWPSWMWANTEILSLARWLREYNLSLPTDQHVGFHGLDVYSLFESIDQVLAYTRKIDTSLAEELQQNYAHFDSYQCDDIAYARATLVRETGCDAAAYATWKRLVDLDSETLPFDGPLLFDAQQNARVVQNAEQYYRSMVRDNVESWNVRDRHMLETLDALLNYYDPTLTNTSKAIVWAHNTHVGDYRATDMVQDGSVNIGGLARTRYGPDRVKLVGFGMNQGTVTAALAWDGPVETMIVPPAQKGSYDALFHGLAEQANLGQFYLIFDQLPKRLVGELAKWRTQRAIGVVYHPEAERRGNYVPTSLTNRYNAFVFIDETEALEPLPIPMVRHKVPQTWPTGV